MTRTATSRLFSAGVLIVLIVILFVYFSSRSLSGAQINKEPATASKPKVENFNFLIAAPYWCTEKGFVSTIEMKNYHVEQPLTITPILYPLDGPEITFNLTSDDNNPVRPESVVQKLLEANGAAGNGGSFRLEVSGHIVHVIPPA